MSKASATMTQGPPASGTPEAEQATSLELANMRLLHEVNVKLAQAPAFEDALDEILAAAAAFTGTDRAIIQLVAADGRRLEIARTLGFDPQDPMIERFRSHGLEQGSELARERRQRLLIEDTSVHPGLVGTEEGEIVIASDVRAAQATPMATRKGVVIGVLSTQFHHPHRPSDDELRLLDLLAWTAADYVQAHRNDESMHVGEERFRLIVENARDYAIFTIDQDGLIEDWLPGARSVFGWDAGEIVGHSVDVTFTPEDRAAGAPARERAEARAKDTAPNVRWHVRKDGSRVFIDGVTTAIRDPNGKVRGFLKIGQDMTERHAAIAAVEESEERLRLVGRAGRIGSFDYDPVAMLLTCSPEYLELYGLPTNSRPPDYPEWLALVHSEDRDWVQKATHEAVADPARKHLDYEFRVCRQDTGELRWLSARTELLRDATGRLTRSIGAQWDITHQRRADRALRESEERFRSFAEASDDVIWIIDARTMELEYLSPAYEQVWGESRDRVLADLTYWGERVHPDDRMPAGEGLNALLAGRNHTAEYRILRADGSIRYIRDTGFPVIDENGEIRRIAGVAQDLTERRLAEQALAESEHRARTLMEGVPQLVWRSRSGGDWTWASPQWSRFTGQTNADSQGRGWLSALHPDDRGKALEAWSRAEEEGFEVDYRLRDVSGHYRWFHTRASPVRDRAGRIVEWLGTSTDVDEMYRLQRHQRVLLAELQHRVRNTLGVVRSIVRRTAETAESVDDMAAHLQGRLGAFSRVQAALTRAAEAGVDLSSLVEDELLAHAARESETITVRGPDVTLEPRAAEALSLAIHELTSNAVKYGALSAPNGRLSVRWSVDEREGRRWLDLAWKEHGVALPDGPSRRGFGLELLERSLPYEHDAITRAEFMPTGFQFNLELPLNAPITRH